MRLKRPRPASPDQVRITREGDTAVIEYAHPSNSVVNLRVGPSLVAMSDAEALELFNDMLAAQAEIAAGVDPTLIEIQPGHPQIESLVSCPADTRKWALEFYRKMPWDSAQTPPRDAGVLLRGRRVFVTNGAPGA